MKAKVSDELKQHFRPEFLNRVDEIVVFHQLTQADIERIVDLMVAEIENRLRDRDMGIELTQAAKALIAKRGYDPVLGARPLRRAIQRDIEDILAEKILFADIHPGEIVVVDVAPGGFRARVHLQRCTEGCGAGVGRRSRWGQLSPNDRDAPGVIRGHRRFRRQLAAMARMITTTMKPMKTRASSVPMIPSVRPAVSLPLSR